jgi:hypothetical protein
MRNDLPGIDAHTAARGPKRARDVVKNTGLELRKRIPLARSARSAPRFCPKNLQQTTLRGPLHAGPATT